MSLYDDIVLPRLCGWAMKSERLLPYRERVVGMANGHVLEIGIGTGLNLPLYTTAVRDIHALEPSRQLIAIARRAVDTAAAPVIFLAGSAEAIPLDDHSIDTVVTTWTLCSIAHVERALGEMRRVLKPGGQLLFVEHGLAPEQSVQRWQHGLTPLWSKFAGGCHLDRPIRALIERAGFDLPQVETSYMKGPRPFTYFYEGRGRPR
ncbi:MAG: class I SAM-dependent methyltransferase [Burkholderiaceae bacterium]|nr:MAG: class I SAM-dependent methyltransferase [Burkholderiaceae bacterium]